MNDIVMIGIGCVFVAIFVATTLVMAACMNSSRISRLEENFHANCESGNNS